MARHMPWLATECYRKSTSRGLRTPSPPRCKTCALASSSRRPGVPKGPGGCGVRPSQPPPMRRPRSCRRHESRPPSRIAGGRRSCSRSSRSTPSRAARAAGPCGHRVHHLAVRDRPDPHTPPHARVHGRAERRAQCPVGPPTVRTGRSRGRRSRRILDRRRLNSYPGGRCEGSQGA